MARVLLPVGVAAFATSLDNTVVNVALPSVARDLRLTTGGLEWVASGYLLAFATLLLAGGSLVDRYGGRAVLLAGLGVFGGAALIGAAATGGTELVLARVAQGIGAALVLPATLALVSIELPPGRRALGAGVWTGANAVALALGPVVGGVLAEHASWRWIFLLHAPLVGVAVALVRRLPRRPPDGSGGVRVDLAGLVLSASGLGLLMWGLVDGQTRGYLSPPVLVAAGVGALLLVALLLAERQVADPVLDLALLRRRVFLGGTVAQVLWGLGLSGAFFFTALLLQDVLGFSPTGAGACFLPLAAALVLTVPGSGPLADRLGVHRTVALGLVLVAAGLLAASTVRPGDGLRQLLPALLLLGVGSGLTTPVVAHVLSQVPPARRGSAAAVLSAARELSGALGIAVTGAVVLGRRGTLLRRGADPAAAFAAGYSRGLLLAAVLVLVGAAVSLTTLGSGGRDSEEAVPAPDGGVAG